MLKKRLLSRACRRSARTGRRGSQKTRVLLIVLGILGISLLAAPGVKADSKITFEEKGSHPMHQNAMVRSKNLPYLDASQPARVATFTFGLG